MPTPAAKPAKPDMVATGPGWWARLGLAFKQVFTSPLGGRGRRGSAPADAQASVSPVLDSAERAQWKAACKSLARVLSRHPSARTVFKQLTVLESTLMEHGPGVVRKLPPELVDRALSQLESLVTDWSDPGLAFLRSKLSVGQSTRRRAERKASQELSVLVDPERLQVREASDSVFLEFQQHFTATRANEGRALHGA